MIGIVGDRRKDGAGPKHSVNALVNYILRLNDDLKEEKILDVWYENIIDETPEGAKREMVFHLNGCEIRTPYVLEHFILSWPSDENPQLKDIHQAGQYVLEQMGLKGNQAVLSLHQDTNNLHLHIAANRYNDDGKLVRTGDGWPENLIHKCCREMELKFNWQYQPNGVYEIKNGQVVKAEPKTSLSKKARDFETFTGQASEQRKLQMVCSKIFNLAKSWQQIHMELAEHGIILNRKGSGGILEVNNIEVKLSKIGRDYSFGNLEKKFGEFEQPIWGEGLPPIEPNSESIMANPLPIIKTNSWEEYNKERTEHYKKLKEYRAIRATQKDIVATRHKKFTVMAKAKYNQMWRDLKSKDEPKHAKYLSFPLIKAKQMAEWDKIKKFKKREWAKFNSQWPRTVDTKFPSYQQWLDNRRDDSTYNRDYDIYYNRRNMGTIEPLDERADRNPAAPYMLIGLGGILNFSMHKSIDTGYLYFEQTEIGFGGIEKNTVAFVDYGQLVKIYIESDEAILAAMQLGKAKWGKIQINGDLEFKQRCFEIAMKNGLTDITNKEFNDIYKTDDVVRDYGPPAQRPQPQPSIEDQERTANMSRRQRLETDFQKYHQAIGAERYRVTCIALENDKPRATWVLGRNPKSKEVFPGFTVEQVKKRFKDIESLSYGEKIHLYFTAVSNDKYHILIDDLSAESLKQVTDDGYKPAYVQESSPGNYQAILNLEKFHEDPKIDKEVRSQLFTALNQKYGDKNVSGAIHPHRIPGTPNPKSKYQKEDGTFPITTIISAEGGMCLKAQAQAEEIKTTVLAHAARTKRTREVSTVIQETQTPEANQITTEAYLIHINDLKEYWRKRVAKINEGAIDFNALLRLRATGHPRGAVEAALRAKAQEWRGHGFSRDGELDRYATNTINAVYGLQGNMDLEKYKNSLERWYGLEGRDLGQPLPTFETTQPAQPEPAQPDSATPDTNEPEPGSEPGRGPTM